MDLTWNFALMRYGGAWSQLRHIFDHHLNADAIFQYHPIMYEERSNLLKKLKEDPNGFLEHLHLYDSTSTFVFHK